MLERRRAGKGGPAADALVGPDDAQTREDRRKDRSRSFMALFKQFWGLLSGNRRLLALSLVLLGIGTLLSLIPLYGTKLVFDNVLGTHPLPKWIPAWVPHEPARLLTVVAVGMVVLTVVSETIGLASRWWATRMTKLTQMSVRRKVFDHAVRLPLHRVYEMKSGGVSSILREDAGGVAELIFSLIYNPSRAVVQLLGSLVILAFTDWRLLLGSLALLPTVWFTHRTWINRIRPLFRDIRSTRQNTDSHATEAFGGMRVVRSFSRQQAELLGFSRNNHLMARQEVFAWWWMRGIDFTWALLIPLASALLLYYGGGRVLSDAAKLQAGQIMLDQALTVGDLVMFLSYLVALLGPIASLANSATGLQNQLAGLDRVLDILAEPREMPSRPGSKPVVRENVRGELRFRDVGFSYPRSEKPNKDGTIEATKQVLAGVNLQVNPGEMIALVGPSGAGKTTLCNLVARFYDPTEGAIYLDGRDLCDIDVESYRRLLGVVEQDTFLFDGTIAQNIAYGRRDATMLEIESAARQANAHEFIEKIDKGYDSIIGERGVKLSGGQRQRLTIARAILADPRILILDEATSNLDTESERLIQSSLRTLMLGRTSFVIAHRLSTIAHADRILVVEGGRIVQQGHHDELMAKNGRYRDMVLLQTSPPPAPPRVKPLVANGATNGHGE